MAHSTVFRIGMTTVSTKPHTMTTSFERTDGGRLWYPAPQTTADDAAKEAP